tara:strand:- start:4233 stop:5381 length:1149 start_codon:yes stop_codon:yes gene_type:complete
MSEILVDFIRSVYKSEDFIPLHEPRFDSKDKDLLIKTLDSTYVSSAGPLVEEFEKKCGLYTGSNFCVSTFNGTSALHAGLKVLDIRPEDEVITQSLTFVATVNAIHLCGASPVFIDVDRNTLGMSPKYLQDFLNNNCEIREDGCWNKATSKLIKACMPMHTFGFPCEIDKIAEICKNYKIEVIEDAAESLGSFYKNKHTGTFGSMGVISFNGNKIITTGSGGMILFKEEHKAKLARHLTTTGKLPHKWEFNHDIPAFNYRLPNLNASLGLSQISKLPFFLESKRSLAEAYLSWGKQNSYNIFKEPDNSSSNYWLNTLIAENAEHKEQLLEVTNEKKIMTRPAWTPMHMLPFNSSFQKDDMKNTIWLYERIVNLPSSVRKNVQ